MEKPIVFTNLPQCEELCHILVSIDPSEKKDLSVKSDFQWQLLKTRLLLYSESNIIATPAAGLLRHIHVIAKKKYLYSDSLSALFQKLKLKVESVGALTLSMYEQCLVYNLLVKLSPFWNKVEKYFVEGRYFLMHRGALHGIELNTILKGDMLMLYASPLRLWLREVLLLDLLPPSNIEETLSKPFYIDLHSERQWVHVLPSFKRGHLVFVTNQIPKDSTFQDYQQMRRHWKNTYGYRLPEDDSSAIYVGISFFGEKDFLYPLECVRRGMHMNVGEANDVVNFAKAVAAKAALVCGNLTKLMNLTELQNIPKIKQSERLKWSDSRLAELDSELLNKWLFQGDDDSVNMTFESQNMSLYKQEEPGQMPLKTAENDPKKTQDYDNWLTKCSQFIDKLTQGGQKRSFLKASRMAYNENGPLPVKTDSNKQSLIPTAPKSEEESNQNLSPFKNDFNEIDSNSNIKKESPESSGKKRYKDGISLDYCHGTVFENTFVNKNEISQLNVAPLTDIPFKPVFKKKKHHHENRAIKTSEERKKKFCKSLNKSNFMTSRINKNVKKNTNEDIQMKKGNSEINNSSFDTNALPVVCENGIFNINKKNVEQRSNTPDITPKEDISFLSHMQQELPLMYENKNFGKIMITKQKVVKRSNTPNSSAPKERKKSALLTTAEIEDLVFMNQLEKANVPSLCSYLKDKGIPYSKDRKKEILLKKVKEIIMPEWRE